MCSRSAMLTTVGNRFKRLKFREVDSIPTTLFGNNNKLYCVCSICRRRKLKIVKTFQKELFAYNYSSKSVLCCARKKF